MNKKTLLCLSILLFTLSAIFAKSTLDAPEGYRKQIDWYGQEPDGINP